MEFPADRLECGSCNRVYERIGIRNVSAWGTVTEVWGHLTGSCPRIHTRLRGVRGSYVPSERLQLVDEGDHAPED
jgi:hypothetical protein